MQSRQVITHADSLLDYGMKWAQLRVPSGDLTKARWPEDPRWTALRDAVFGGTPLQRVVRVPELMDLDRVVSQFVGTVATAGAYFEEDDYMNTLQRLSFAAEMHIVDRGEEFRELVAKKHARILSGN